MEKTTSCKCKSGCQNRRCSCLKNNESCGKECSCTDCQNPLNGVDTEKLYDCALQNIHEYINLSEEELDTEYKLPCGCENATLRKLINTYNCSKCDEEYWYSFCWDNVVEDSCSWHCNICGQCRDWREWHCENCNKCVYGVTRPCERCGNKSPYSDMGF